MNEHKEITVDHSELSNIETILNALGFHKDQQLMKESISFYDVVVNISTDGQIVNNLLISKYLKMYCLWVEN